MRPSISGAIVLIVALALGACDLTAPEWWPEGPGLWIAPGTFDASEHAAREVEALFADQGHFLLVEVGRIDWQGPRPVRQETWPQEWLPASPSLLAVRLDLTGAAGRRSELRESLAGALAEVVEEAKRQGISAKGLHLHLENVTDPRGAAAVLRPTRSRLPPGWLLALGSADLHLDAADWAILGEVADLLVPVLYGQEPGQRDAPDAWDLRRFEERLGEIAALERPFMVGIITLGSVSRLGPRGEILAASTETSLRQIIGAPGIRPEAGFTLAGLDRQVYAFRSTRTTFIPDLGRVERGERVRVVRTTSVHLAELLRRLRAWAPENLMGEVFYRLPRPEESAGFSASGLRRARALRPVPVELALDIRSVGGSPRAPLIQVELTNSGLEATDLALHENNFVEIRAVQGGYFSTVQPGDFERFTQLLARPGEEPVLELRRPNIVRFYFALLEGGETIVSGPVRWHPVSGADRVVATGEAVLPAGRIHRLLEVELPSEG